MKNIATALKNFIKEDKSTPSLLIDEADIPHPSFMYQPIQAPCITAFFGEQRNRTDFEYLSSVYLMDFQVKHPQDCYGVKNPMAANFDIPPVLSQDDILYTKEGDTLYKISIDKKRPCFQKINLATGEISAIALPKIQEIVNKWLNRTPEKASILANQLVALSKRTPKALRLNPRLKKTYPHYNDVYRFFALKDSFIRESTELKELSNTFDLRPVITEGGRVIFKRKEFFYKIELGDEIKFERLSKRGHYVMTQNEVTQMLDHIQQYQLFGAKTSLVCNALNLYYQKMVEPKFNNRDQLRINKENPGILYPRPNDNQK